MLTTPKFWSDVSPLDTSSDTGTTDDPTTGDTANVLPLSKYMSAKDVGGVMAWFL